MYWVRFYFNKLSPIILQLQSEHENLERNNLELKSDNEGLRLELIHRTEDKAHLWHKQASIQLQVCSCELICNTF